MKKVLLILFLVFGLLLIPAVKVSAAEETETEEPKAVEVEETKEEWFESFWKEYFNAEKIAMYMSWLAYIGTIIGLVIKLKKLKEANQLTLANVTDNLTVVIKQVASAEIKAQSEKFLPDLIKVQEKTNSLLSSVTKILALSQENTPESRVAILQVIENMGVVAKEVTETAKTVIEEEVKLIEEKKKETEDKLNEIIDVYDGTSI